jgi:hypothetical protein
LILKLSVLASGVVLLDGEPIELDALDRKLGAADKQSTAIWYYRQAAAIEPPPEAKAVIQLVIQHKLPISMSSLPDFSDYVDAKGVSHPRAAPAGPRMPSVLIPSNLEEIFNQIRNLAAGETRQGGLVILRPNRSYLVVPGMPANPELQKFASSLAHLLPPGVQRNVAVIGNTDFGNQAPSVAAVDKAIPFFGLLMALSYLGHAVWIFEGHGSALAAGCRHSDALIVDSALLPLLPADWQDTARAAMRSPNMLLHDRASSQLRVISKLGTALNRLEFKP